MKFFINLFIGFLIPIGIIIGAIWYYSFFDHNRVSGHSIPALIVGVCALFWLLINLYVVIRLYIKETELIKKFGNNKWRLDCDSFYWFFPSTFAWKYKNEKRLTLIYSLFCASGVYCLGVIVTIVCIHGNISAVYNEQVVSQSPPFMNFLFGEGAVIAFMVLIFTIYTLINTILIQKQRETEIQTKDELYALLQSKFDKNDKIWKNVKSKFVYIYDYSIALGLASDGESFFPKFCSILSDFLKSDEKLTFRAIVNDPKCNIPYYKENYPKFENDESKIINHLYNAQDLFITYLNRNINEHLSSKQQSEDLRKSHCIFFEKTPDIYIPKEIVKENVFSYTEIEGKLKSFQLDKSALINLAKSNQDKYNTVFFVENIGIVRFIVTNKFVIQFVLGKKSDNKPAPAGFISEDITLIERYKNAFEEYRDKIVLKNIDNRPHTTAKSFVKTILGINKDN